VALVLLEDGAPRMAVERLRAVVAKIEGGQHG
jgi:hypothetical protein